MLELIQQDNMSVSIDKKCDLIYGDMIYENDDFDWIRKYWEYLNDKGIFIVQTDYHTNWIVRNYFERELPYWTRRRNYFVNELVWKNEWGNHPKNKFHQCYDNIIIYSKSENYKFYPERIQVPKATANTKLNPSGRETKTATAWIDDICLTTTSKERVKKDDGHLIRWQKPLKLFDRIIAPFTDEGDLIIDPFMGSASLGEWSVKNNRNYIGIELYEDVFKLAKERIEKCMLENHISY